MSAISLHVRIFASGFPGIRALPARARPDRIAVYADAIVTREFEQYGYAARRPAALLELDEDLLEPERVAATHGPIAGQLFEALVGLSLQAYAAVNGARLSYFRTRDGAHEADFILTRKRQVVAVEVKLAHAIDDRDVRHLVWLKDQLGPRLADAIIVSTGPETYRRSDGVAVVPAALLGA